MASAGSSPFLQLPPEIVYHIVSIASQSHGAPRETLKSLSLACKALPDFTRPHLLSSVSINDGERLESVIAWLKSADCSERGIVRSVRFPNIDATPGATGTLVSQSRVATLLFLLPQVRSLEVAYFSTTTIDPFLYRAFNSLEELETLTLTISTGWNVHSSLLACLQTAPRLRHIRFDYDPLSFQAFSLHNYRIPPLEIVSLNVGISHSTAEWMYLLGGAACAIRYLDLSGWRATELLHILPLSITALRLDYIPAARLLSNVKLRHLTTLCIPEKCLAGLELANLSSHPLFRRIQNLVLMIEGDEERKDRLEQRVVFPDPQPQAICTLSLQHLVFATPHNFTVERLLVLKGRVEKQEPKFRISWCDAENLDLLDLADGKQQARRRRVL